MRHGVTARGGRGKGQINNAEGNIQPLRRFLCNQLTHAGNLERRLLDGFRYHVKRLPLDAFQRALDHARPGHADVDGTFRLAHAAESTRHKRVILHCVAENDQLRAAQPVRVRRQRRRLFDNFTHFAHGVHVDARAGAADVDRGAEPLGRGEHFGDGSQQALVRQRCALVHQGRVAAQEVHAHFLRRAVKRLGNRARVALTDQAHCGHGDALVDNRNAQFTLNGFARAHKVFGDAADFIVHALCAGFRGRMRAVQQIDAQRNGADIKVLLLNHRHRLEDFARFNHPSSPPALNAVHRVENIHALEVDIQVHFLADGLERLIHGGKLHLGAVKVNDHHHREASRQDGLRDVQNVDVEFRQLGRDAGDNTGSILSGDGNQGLGHA